MLLLLRKKIFSFQRMKKRIKAEAIEQMEAQLTKKQFVRCGKDCEKYHPADLSQNWHSTLSEETVPD